MKSTQLFANTKAKHTDDPHLHDILNGCEVVKKKKFLRMYNQLPVYLPMHWCKTHEVWICSCNWEIGFHYGEAAYPLNLQRHKHKSKYEKVFDH